TAAGCIGQDELRGHHDLASVTGQPWIDLRVGAQDLLVTDIEATCDVGERVVLAGCHHLHHPDHVLIVAEREALVGYWKQLGWRWQRRGWWCRWRHGPPPEQRASCECQAKERRSCGAGASDLHRSGIMTHVAAGPPRKIAPASCDERAAIMKTRDFPGPRRRPDLILYSSTG